MINTTYGSFKDIKSAMNSLEITMWLGRNMLCIPEFWDNNKLITYCDLPEGHKSKIDENSLTDEEKIRLNNGRKIVKNGIRCNNF